MKNFFAPYNFPVSVDVALLLLRLVFGIAFIMHGLGKIQSPMAWMGPDSFIPPIFQLLAAVAEFGGGIGLILGLFTRLWALGLVVTMAVAVYVHAVIGGDPFVSATGGKSYELAATYLAVALIYLAAGAGRFSADKLIFGDRANLR